MKRRNLPAPVINLHSKLVIPAAAERRAEIQIRRWDYWIHAFAGMTGRWISVPYLIATLITKGDDMVPPFKGGQGGF